jgi:hypothetical protein
MFGVINITQKKTKVQRQRQYNKNAKITLSLFIVLFLGTVSVLIVTSA